MKILITGATNGMGKGLTLALAKIQNQNHEIILLGRSPELCKKTLVELQKLNTNLHASYIIADLSSLEAVKNALVEIKSQHSYLDGIFINAGLGYAAKQVQTIDGMDSHFQVNYLAQFYLLLNLLELLEQSKQGGRVIFNATPGGTIHWDDIQMTKDWGYEKAIQQAMVAKRMLVQKLHSIYIKKQSKISFMAFSIHKTVWSNQLEIIPSGMRFMASIMKALGQFISIEACGEVLAPLFLEDAKSSMQKSGLFWTWKAKAYVEIPETDEVKDATKQERLFTHSLELCRRYS